VVGHDHDRRPIGESNPCESGVQLSQRRIEVAKMLLTHKTAMGVSDVARAAGFSSRATFTRNMKQLGGASATEIRAADFTLQDGS